VGLRASLDAVANRKEIPSLPLPGNGSRLSSLYIDGAILALHRYKVVISENMRTHTHDTGSVQDLNQVTNCSAFGC
jgi:hypothetical protein